MENDNNRLVGIQQGMPRADNNHRPGHQHRHLDLAFLPCVCAQLEMNFDVLGGLPLSATSQQQPLSLFPQSLSHVNIFIFKPLFFCLCQHSHCFMGVFFILFTFRLGNCIGNIHTSSWLNPFFSEFWNLAFDCSHFVVFLFRFYFSHRYDMVVFSQDNNNFLLRLLRLIFCY